MTDDKKTQVSLNKNGDAGAESPKFRFVQRQDLPEDDYADGAAGLIFGPNVVKVDLFRVVGFDAETKMELRAVSHRLVLPVSAIPELTRLLQGFSQVLQQQRAAAQASAGATSAPEPSRLN